MVRFDGNQGGMFRGASWEVSLLAKGVQAQGLPFPVPLE